MGAHEKEFSVGDRVYALSDGCKATVKYTGTVQDTSGSWLGVEWDDPNRGKHDGSHKGVKYFETRHHSSGSFIRPQKVSRGISFAEGVRSRYGVVTDDNAGVDQEAVDRLRKETNAPFLEMVGFKKVNEKQGDFMRLRIVSLKDSGIAGLLNEQNIGEWMPNVCDLDLSENLLNSWNEVIDICVQLKHLRNLDVSGNQMCLPEENTTLGNALGNLRQLVVKDMNYTWKEVAFLIEKLTKLETLHVMRNNISDIPELPENMLQNLRALDLSDNPLKSWENVMKFSKLPNLTYLDVNGCDIESVRFNDSDTPFPSLLMLRISRNNLSDWTAIGKLIRLKIQDIRIRNNPVLETENGPTCRQIIIASIPTLKVVNGTEIFKEERYGAEVDYVKKFGREYLDLLKENDHEGLANFFEKYPRYSELVERFGPPEEAELSEPSMNKSIKSSLLEVIIKCPSSGDFKPMVKKIPPSLTVHKLRTLLQRLVKVKGYELKISYHSKDDPSFQVEMDNDLRELSFYDIADGDSIIVTW